MPTIIAQLQTCATGPARLAAALRRKTLAVRRYRATLAPLGQVRAALPVQVMGGALLDLVSDQLRALLPGAPSSAPAAPNGSAARPGFAPPSRAALGRDAGRIPALAERRMLDTGSLAAGTPQGGRDRSLADIRWPAERDLPEGTGLRTGGDPRGTLAEIGRSQVTSRPRLWPEPAQPNRAERHDATAGGILARKVQEYWHLQRTAAQPAQQAQVASYPEPTLRSAPPLPGAAAEAADPAWQERAEYRLVEHELAARMSAFAAGRPWAAQPEIPAAAERPATQQALAIGVAAGGAGSTAELSDKLADLLREQAIQHGIDIT